MIKNIARIQEKTRESYRDFLRELTNHELGIECQSVDDSPMRYTSTLLTCQALEIRSEYKRREMGIDPLINRLTSLAFLAADVLTESKRIEYGIK